VWTWARDRRFPGLAEWLNTEVRSGRVLICDQIILELVRLAPNETRANELAARLSAFDSVPMPRDSWSTAREVQLALAGSGDHRRVPPADLLIAAAAERAGVPLIHYDRDYEGIASMTQQPHRWFVARGALAEQR
jgi:predicted nucleic acid-binding protein